MRISKSLCSNPLVRTERKVSKYGVFSGPYFPVFRLNMDIYGVNWKNCQNSRGLETYVCVSGVKQCSFFGKFGELCFLEIRSLALLPTKCWTRFQIRLRKGVNFKTKSVIEYTLRLNKWKAALFIVKNSNQDKFPITLCY